MKENHADYLKIEAIKSRDVQAMKRLIGREKFEEGYIAPLKLKSQVELFEYINAINLNDYLGIQGTVSCILPEHAKHTQSANIYTTDDGTQVYKCFGCGKTYTIVSITEKLASCKRSKAIEFIKDVYGLELLQSEWAKEQKQLLIDSANYLDSNDFKLTFPELNKLIKKRKFHIKAILLHFSQYVNDDMQIDGKPFFFASYDTLLKVCEIKGNRNMLSQSITLFALLNMLTKLQIEDIPDKELKKAREIAAKYNQPKLTGFYMFEEYGTLLFEDSEDIAIQLKQSNMTFKGLSREYVYRTFGKQLADRVYPQYKDENKKGNSYQADQHTIDITMCLFRLLDTKGYATEKEIVKMLENKYSYKSTEVQIKKSLQEMLLAYGLVRVKASKANKELYDIEDDKLSYQCNIICRATTTLIA